MEREKGDLSVIKKLYDVNRSGARALPRAIRNNHALLSLKAALFTLIINTLELTPKLKITSNSRFSVRNTILMSQLKPQLEHNNEWLPKNLTG